MTDPDEPPVPDRLPDLLVERDREATAAWLEQLAEADTEERKRALRTARNVAQDRPGAFAGIADPLGAFLSDENRAVRLTTAKLFVALAESEPAAVLPVVDTLAERLADDEEFSYVRGRCAEALGHVAVDSPEAVADPEILAEIRIGLSFDDPEVTEKLAKALAYVALGDPDRLRHQVSSLADHLDDADEFVRYYLCTALVVVGCRHPAKLIEAEGALRARLADENPYVQGRAAEALGLLLGSGVGIESRPGLDHVDAEDDGTPSFLTTRVQFCRRRLDEGVSVPAPDGVGTIQSVRDGIQDAADEITSPDGGECPHCGLALSDDGPPMCPGCGAPR